MKDAIRPPRLADAIASHIERMILEGVLRPGERLTSERDLAKRLDVSRPSLREAIDQLEKRGLLVSKRGGQRSRNSSRRCPCRSPSCSATSRG